MKTTKAYDYGQQIDNIMNNFDFIRVRKTMVTLAWKWSGEQGLYQPNIDDLRRSARHTLMTVVNTCARSISSGGFIARREDGILSLSFVVSDWNGRLDLANTREF